LNTLITFPPIQITYNRLLIYYPALKPVFQSGSHCSLIQKLLLELVLHKTN